MALGLALAGAGAQGWRWWTVERFIESTDNAYIEGDISAVSPQVAGYVKDIRVAENQSIRAGDVLATLDDAEYVARVAQAQAAVAVRQAALAMIDAKSSLETAHIEAAAAAVIGAEAEWTRARKDLERSSALLASQNVSRRHHDAMQAETSKTEAAVTRAKAVLTAQLRQIGVLEASRQEAEAQLHHAQAQLRLAELELENTLIRAPIDGVIGNRGVQIGQYVRPGTRLMSVVPLSEIYIVANFKETQLGAMRVGQPVMFQVDAYPDHRLTGQVDSVAPASAAQFSLLPPENAVGNFTKIVQRVPVRIAITPGHPLTGQLKPGLSATVSVNVRPGTDGLVPPNRVFGTAQAAPVDGLRATTAPE